MVITYQAPNGERINICQRCAKDLAADWPKSELGEEYCTVSRGDHDGKCDICQGEG